MRGGRSRPPRIRCRPRVDRIGGVRGVSHPLRDVARRTRVVQEAQSVVSIGQATAGEVPDRRRAGAAVRFAGRVATAWAAGGSARPTIVPRC